MCWWRTQKATRGALRGRGEAARRSKRRFRHAAPFSAHVRRRRARNFARHNIENASTDFSVQTVDQRHLQ